MRGNRQGDLAQPTGRPDAGAGPGSARFTADVLHNNANRIILRRLPLLHLPDAWLVAGCLFQTVWNRCSGREPAAGIKDYDLFYFDGSDLSEKGEAAVAQRVNDCYADLGITVEAKNQARVHLWYPEWFGHSYPALGSTREGIDRFLVPGTCVGLQVPRQDAPPVLYAPNGLTDLYAGILRPNPLCDHRPLFLAKARSYQARWDWLTIVEP